MRFRRIQCAAATLALTAVLGGCYMVPGYGQRSTSPPPKKPIETLSNEGTMKQVIEPARQIVKTAGLQGVFAGFSYEACNDQGEPPYRGRIDASFEIPKDVEPQKYVNQVAKTMVQHGWIDGPPPGNRAFGTLIHTPEVWVILSPHPVAKEDGALRVFGQCRNMVNHREDPVKDFDVTDRVVS